MKITINGTGLVLLTATFIVLKLTNVIDWSWWWVLCPLWIPLLIFILGLLIGLLTIRMVGKEAQDK